MAYSVLWMPSALAELADIWTDSTDRRAVGEAVDEIDRLLKFSPLELGEARDHARRMLFLPPVVVTYDVSKAHKLVYELRVSDITR